MEKLIKINSDERYLKENIQTISEDEFTHEEADEV